VHEVSEFAGKSIKKNKKKYRRGQKEKKGMLIRKIGVFCM